MRMRYSRWRIERNGVEFYLRTAEEDLGERSKRKLRELAEIEVVHEKTFAAMRAEISGRESSGRLRSLL